MKEISAEDKLVVEQLINQGLVRNLSPAMLEKDLLVREAVQTVYQAAKDQGLSLVFAGGTALSQARGILMRMSEDADFRMVIPDEVRAKGSKNAIRTYCSAVKHELVRSLDQAGFPLLENGLRARNDNQYIRGLFAFAPKFESEETLRQHIKLELIAIDPIAPVESMPLYSIVDRARMAYGQELPERPSLPVLGIEETISDKLVGYLRRTAAFHAGANRFPYDDRLVRHLYDIHAVSKAYDGDADLVARTQPLLVHTIRKDQETYGKEFPAFAGRPLDVLRQELGRLKEADTRDRYQRFCQSMIYGDIPSFEVVVSSFQEMAEKVLGEIRPEDVNRRSNALGTMEVPMQAEPSNTTAEPTTDAERIREIGALNKPISKFTAMQEMFNANPKVKEALESASKYNIAPQGALHQAMDKDPHLKNLFLRMHEHFEKEVQPALERQMELAGQLQDPQQRRDIEGTLHARLKVWHDRSKNWPNHEDVAHGPQATRKPGLSDILLHFLRKVHEKIFGKPMADVAKKDAGPAAGQAQATQPSATPVAARTEPSVPHRPRPGRP
jgi:hypothetical protein